jgi:hypothetical protein
MTYRLLCQQLEVSFMEEFHKCSFLEISLVTKWKTSTMTEKYQWMHAMSRVTSSVSALTNRTRISELKR